MKRRLTALTLGILSLLSAPAFAQARLTASVPAAQSSVYAAPTELTLTFSEPVDPARCIVSVLNATTRNTVGKTQPRAVPDHPNMLSLGVNIIQPGQIYVTWRVVSANTGEKSQGSFSFAYGTMYTQGVISH